MIPSGVKFINIFRARFSYETSFRQLFSSYYIYMEKLPKRCSYEKFVLLTLMKLTAGVEFTNVLRVALMLEDPKYAKRHWLTLDCLFALLGSLRIIAACKHDGEIDSRWNQHRLQSLITGSSFDHSFPLTKQTFFYFNYWTKLPNFF